MISLAIPLKIPSKISFRIYLTIPMRFFLAFPYHFFLVFAFVCLKFYSEILLRYSTVNKIDYFFFFENFETSKKKYDGIFKARTAGLPEENADTIPKAMTGESLQKCLRNSRRN